MMNQYSYILYLHFNNIEITLSMNSLFGNNSVGVAIIVMSKEHGIASRLSTKHILRSLFGELQCGPPPSCSEATVLSLNENNNTKN